MVSTADTDIDIPTTSTRKATEQQIEKENNMENEQFSLEEDTRLIIFVKTHQRYLASIRNNDPYVKFICGTPTSPRTCKELRTQFVEHIMPKLYTYDCLTYEEMVTYYD